jgi:hypothetical protein
MPDYALIERTLFALLAEIDRQATLPAAQVDLTRIQTLDARVQAALSQNGVDKVVLDAAQEAREALLAVVASAPPPPPLH